MCLEVAQKTRKSRGHLVSRSMLPGPFSLALPLVPPAPFLPLLLFGDAIFVVFRKYLGII